MVIRIGVGFGGWPFPEKTPDMLWDYVDAAEALDIDSIWLSDRSCIRRAEHGADDCTFVHRG